MHYEDADDLIQTDNRTPAQKWLDAEIERRHGNEQGHEAVIYEIALELRQELEDAQGEIRALRATEAGLRDRVKELEEERDRNLDSIRTNNAILQKYAGQIDWLKGNLREALKDGETLDGIRALLEQKP